jgi:assimilatory nitrate reductase catalytic subunit
MNETRSTCPYCGVGCGVLIQSEGERITGVRGDPDHPANFGRLCTKGATLHLTAAPITLQRRLLQPAWRARRGEAPQPLPWDEAGERIAAQLAGVLERDGPQAIGFYISGQLLTEDYHAFNKLARALVGTNNIDSNSRLCMSSAVVGYKQSLGADAPPACYEDIELADCLLISGANPAWAHPILFRRLEAARARRPQMKIIVIDPRRTETAEFADLHLQLLPGSDVALSHGLLALCIAEGWIDEAFIAAHTAGFEALRAQVLAMTPERVQRECGIAPAQLRQAAQWFAQSPASLSLYCMGLNQSSSGTAKNTALINLHLATGQIGRPGAGPFSLTGQPNAMGGRETGGMASLLPGHRDPGNPAHRAEIARLWGVDALPATPGKTAIELFEAAARGEIKVLWIACTNPAQSLPDQALVRRALQRCELVILQEAFGDTATAAYADVLLPAASWGEKEGTVTNSERRISRVRAAVPAPGQARADWRIVREVARALEQRLRPGHASLFAADTPEQLWLEHREATRGRDLDISGLSYALLDELGPQQWPFPAGARQGQARLYEDRRFLATPEGRARFITQAPAAARDALGADFPLTLTTGRLRDQWHGMSRTGLLGRLFAHEGRPLLRLHPQTLAAQGLQEGDIARLASPRGALHLPVCADAAVAPGQAYVAMHWGEEHVSGRDDAGLPLLGINAVTQPAFCPDSKQPELKFSAVAVQPLALPWRLSACAWGEAGHGLRALLREFDYAACHPVAGPADSGLQGWVLEAASAVPPPPALVQRVARLLGLQGPDLLRYEDAGRDRLRLLDLQTRPAGGLQLRALLCLGQRGEGDWLQGLWREAADVAPQRRLLLAPESRQAQAPRSPQVCNCFDVSEARIRFVLGACAGSAGERLAALQGQLRCGTQCGSCLPSLRRLVDATPVQEPA